MTKQFSELGLSDVLLRAVQSMGFEETTPIQEKTIPAALSGRDVIGQAPTGTGKTAAFGLPMLEMMNVGEGIQSLVVAPTRELAVQVAEELNKLGRSKGVTALPIYGGQDIQRQIRRIKDRPSVIVGTPGRLLDHIRRRTIRLQSVNLVVLDEADEMLNMGFIEDIRDILSNVPEERQTLLFSATMPRAIEELSRQFMTDPLHVKVTPRTMTVPNTEQIYVEVKESGKFDVLCNLLDLHNPEAAIIFGRTKKRVDELTEALIIRGYSADGIHGDLNQSKRDTVMGRFKAGRIDVLVATDVAARGLDIDHVTHVYNFDIPQEPEGYVHRIGRTGRAGRTGLAATLVSHGEMRQLRFIESIIKTSIKRLPAPTLTEAREGLQQLTVNQLIEACDHPDTENFRRAAQELLLTADAVTITAAALRLLSREPNTTPVKISSHAPAVAKKARYSDNRPRSQGKPQGRRSSGGQRRKDNQRGRRSWNNSK